MAKYLNELDQKTYQVNLWKNVSFTLSITVVMLGVSTSLLTYKVLTNFAKERLILVPALQRKMIVPAHSYISETFIKGAATRVVELQEQWSYESIQDHYKELFDQYYSHGLMELTQANLTITNRFAWVKQNKAVSIFKFNLEKSHFTYCKKVKRVCAIVTGTRSLFINHNEPYLQKEVTYFLLAESVWPSEEHPFALRFSRIKIDDSGAKSYSNLKSQYDAAINGVI